MKDAAILVGVDYRTIIESGTIPVVQLGPRRMVPHVRLPYRWRLSMTIWAAKSRASTQPGQERSQRPNARWGELRVQPAQSSALVRSNERVARRELLAGRG